MITTDTAALALAVAQGLIKFGGRLDRLLAEKVAVRSGLELALPAIDFSPGPNVVLPRLQAYLANSSASEPGPLGATERASLAALVPKNYAFDPADLGALRRFFALAFPDEAVALAVSPDDTFVAYLRESMPSVRDHLPEKADSTDKAKQANLQAAWLASAFYVDPGADLRQLGYPVRVGLLVTDVLAEFGAENTQRFVRDESLRSTVQSVLEHFAEPNLETFDAWSPLLRHALNATLDGVLATESTWQGENPWLGAVLGALADARTAGGDDYLLGLTQGRGYSALVGSALGRTAGVLSTKDAPAFQLIAADILTTAAPLVQKNPESFGSFFSDHWSDLLHAGLVSLETHGSSLMAGKSPVLGDVLNAVVASLAKTPNATLLTNDTVIALAQAAVGAVATHPEIWQKKNGPAWLDTVISSAVKAVSDPKVQATFTSAGLTDLLEQVATAVAVHPEWIVAEPGLVQDLVGTTVSALSGVGAGTQTATAIAGSVVTKALAALSARPDLLGSGYTDVVASVAGLVAEKVEDGTITSLQASDLAAMAANAVLLQPTLFSDAKKNLAGAITNAVLRAAKADKTGVLAGATITGTVQQLLAVFARNGAGLVSGSAIATLEDQLTQVLGSGLLAAKTELGQRIDLPMLPTVLSGLVTEWSQGSLTPGKMKEAAFTALFSKVVERVSAVTPLRLPT
jgi:hypothetical protein